MFNPGLCLVIEYCYRIWVLCLSMPVVVCKFARLQRCILFIYQSFIKHRQICKMCKINIWSIYAHRHSCACARHTFNYFSCAKKWITFINVFIGNWSILRLKGTVSIVRGQYILLIRLDFYAFTEPGKGLDVAFLRVFTDQITKTRKFKTKHIPYNHIKMKWKSLNQRQIHMKRILCYAII